MAETEQQRLNRELIELLNELRVVLPGVQVLFAFLLTIPFARGFPKLQHLDRDAYFAALLATVLSTILLITPSAYHRIVFRHHDKQDLLEVSNKLILAGMAILAVAMTCSLFVISDFIFGHLAAAIATAATTVAFTTLWYMLPTISRRHSLTIGDN
jgi:Family of unknown function (DUF6328)